jgi:YidC/Oxa1 family membrane protein insertase
MDKRNLIFITLITITFFLTQHFFSPKKTPPQNQTKKTQQIETVKEQPSANIKIVKLYADENKEELFSHAIVIDDNFFTLINDKKKPEYLFNTNEKIYLASESTNADDVVVYRSDDAKNISVPDISTIKNSEIQIVSFNSEKPTIFCGHYKDGNYSVPLNSECKNSLALIKLANNYYPIAIFNNTDNQFKDISQIDGLKNVLAKAKAKNNWDNHSLNEDFFVLENEFQQIVFSNVGGAIAEINLPFKSKTNRSVVNPVEIDRQIEKQSPQNDYFPLNGYYVPNNKQKQSGKLGGYYPLLRRSIKNKDGSIGKKFPAKFYAFNIVSDETNIDNAKYRVVNFDKNSITFELYDQSRKIRKTYTLGKGPYCIDVSIQIDGDSKGLWVSSGIPEVELMSNRSDPMIKLRINQGDKTYIDKIKLPKTATTVSSISPDWACNSNGFFGIIVDPLSEIASGYRSQRIAGDEIATKFSLIDAQHDLYPASKYPGYTCLLPLSSSQKSATFRVFAGPFQNNILKEIDSIYSEPMKGYNPEYVTVQSFHGIFSIVSEPFAKFLFMLMNLFYKLTSSWGFSIILLTLVTKIMLFPLNSWSIKSMQRMQDAGPQANALKKRYKKDPKKAQIETMKLYKEKGANPVTGCLPNIIQIPFILGMLDLLKSTFDLRGVAFIPGWIDNLAAPDIAFSWGQPIFFVGTSLHVLPILLGLSMFLQSKLNFSKTPTSQMTDQQKQQKKMMGTIAPVFLAVVLYNFPSGLAIYWIFSTIFGIFQQWLIMKQTQKKEANKPNLEVIK